jgi:nicotinic acid phosphoribosyltransferase
MSCAIDQTNPLVGPLLTDMYQISMAYAHWKNGKHNEYAVFDLFFRKNPFGGEFCVSSDEIPVVTFHLDLFCFV